MSFSSRPPRSKRSPLAARAPRLERLRRRLPASSNPNIARSQRLLRPIGAIGALLLAGLLVRGWTAWRYDIAGQIERAARAQYIPQLEKQLGQKIEVGNFSTDWRGRIQVEDITVGRNAKLPTGSLISIKRASITLDLVGLALGRTRFPDAISAVDLDSPGLYVRRDTAGKLNLASLLKSSGGGSGTRWNGRVGVQNGRVFYQDDTIRNLRKQPLQLDASGANGTLLVSSPRLNASAFDFEGNTKQTLLRGQNLGAFPLRGRVVSADKTPARGWLETQTPALPVTLATSWARLPVQLRSGTVGGTVQIAFVGTQFAPRGDVQVRGVAFDVTRPNASSVAVKNLSGPLQFAGTAIQTTGLSARVANANWTAKGRAAFDKGEVVFDGNAATRGLRLADVRALVGTKTLPLQLNAASIDVDVRASGTPQNLRADGTVQAREATWNDANGRRARFPTIRATGVLVRNQNAPLGFAARFEAPQGQVQTVAPRVGTVLVSAQWSGSVRGQGNALDVDARADGLNASSDSLGQSRAASVRLVASTRDARSEDWRGQLELDRLSTSGLRLAALVPRASLVQNSGLVSGRFNFEGSIEQPELARASGALSLSQIAVSPSAIPVSARAQIERVFGSRFDVGSYLAARDLSANVSLRNGTIQVANARAQTAGGLVTASFSTPLRSFAPRYTFASPQLRVPTAMLLDLARSRGVELSGNLSARGSLAGEGDGRKTIVRAVLALDASRFAAQGRSGTGRLEGDGVQMRVAADLNGAVRRWSARLLCGSLNVRSGRLGTTGLLIPPDLNGARVAGAQIVATSRSGVAAWTMNLNARGAALPIRALAGRPVVTLRDVSAVVNPRTGGVDVSRIGANWSRTGRIDGSLSLDRRGVTGEVLAREVEAQALQTLLARTSVSGSRLQGRLNFKAAIRPGQAPQLDAQMASGTLLLKTKNGASSLPIRALVVRTQTQNGQVEFQNVSGFVNEARIQASGRALLNAGKIETDVSVAGLSLAPLARLAGGQNLSSLAGLARGTVHVAFDARRNEVALDGRLHLDGGAFRGASLDATDARIDANWNGANQSGALKISDWRGQLEGAPFSGNVALDTRANSWSVQLSAPKIGLQRFARLKARLQNASATDSALARLAPPVTGTASALVDVSGTLRGKDKQFRITAQTGLARLNVPDLKWRARTLGELDGTFNVSDGRLTFERLRLLPPADESGRAPTLSLVGSVPLDSQSGPLDARLSVGEAQLDFFVDTLREGRDALVSSDVKSPFLNSVVSYAGKLPRGLQGRVALNAEFGGTFAKPIFKVSRLALRGGRAPLPLGGLSLPATLDASFTVAGGEIAIERAQFRLAKTERNPSDASVTEAAPPEPENADAGTTPVAGAAPPEPDNGEDDDTLVQVQPDSKLSLEGDSSLVADVYNANLSQLAPWVPALRGKNGEVLLRGELEGFSVRVQGPAFDPTLTASIDAQNIAFRGQTLERLRINRLDIGGGVAKIEAGNLSVKEGGFESSAAFGSVAWDWKTGPVPDGDLKLQFPLATRDFGALAALFVPGISRARADEFEGNLIVAGTVRAPQFLGDVRVQNASFQTVSSLQSPLAIGVKNLSGALRFVNGNRLEIVPDNLIKGELVAPETVVTPSPTPLPVAPGSKTKKSKIVKTVEENAVRARGAFQLRGSVELAQADLTQLSAEIPQLIADNKYALRLDISNGRVDAPGMSGVQNALLSASFNTLDANNAAQTQVVRWIGAGIGTAASKKANAGEVVSRGAIRLRSDFATGFPSLARSFPLGWTSGANDLRDAEAAKSAPDSAFEDARPQLVFKGFGVSVKAYGSAVVDGRLVLDKAPATNRAPDASRLQTIAGAPSLRPLEPQSGARLFGAWNEPLRPLRVVSSLISPREIQNEGDANDPDLPIRMGGNLVVSSAQIVGGGGGDGQVTRLSLLPDAPRLDIRLSLGRDVEVVNAAVRARLGGDIALSGTPSSPLLLGTVQVLDGQVRFPNARARIDEGRVSINISRDAETDLPRTRLEVDATARGQAGRYAITLRLRGPLQFDARNAQNASNLRIEVTSNPSLSQDEAFSQLLGLSPRSSLNANGSVSTTSTNQAYAQAVLQLVSAPFFSGFERSVAQALGLSSVSFEYRFNEPLAFEFSKTVGDRVLVTYRRSLGATQLSQGRTPFQLRVDYRLKGDVFLGFQLDERQVNTLTIGTTRRF